MAPVHVREREDWPGRVGEVTNQHVRNRKPKRWTIWRSLLIGCSVIAALVFAAPYASAGGAYYGKYNPAYAANWISWGASCGLTNSQLSFGFAVGRDGRYWRLHDVYISNRSNRLVGFDYSRISIRGSDSDSTTYNIYTENIAPYSSRRIRVERTFPGSKLTTWFYPYLGTNSAGSSNSCGLTNTQLYV